MFYGTLACLVCFTASLASFVLFDACSRSLIEDQCDPLSGVKLYGDDLWKVSACTAGDSEYCLSINVY